MNKKWYSLTRPAVVHFNPPRDMQRSIFVYIDTKRLIEYRHKRLKTPSMQISGETVLGLNLVRICVEYFAQYGFDSLFHC